MKLILFFLSLLLLILTAIMFYISLIRDYSIGVIMTLILFSLSLLLSVMTYKEFCVLFCVYTGCTVCEDSAPFLFREFGVMANTPHSRRLAVRVCQLPPIIN